MRIPAGPLTLVIDSLLLLLLLNLHAGSGRMRRRAIARLDAGAVTRQPAGEQRRTAPALRLGEAFVSRQQRAHRRLPLHWIRALLDEQVLVVVRRAADGLAGVVDDDVEAREGALDVGAKVLELGQVAEVEPEAVQPVLPLAEICAPGAERQRSMAVGADSQAPPKRRMCALASMPS
jgi:hypothetical protein